MRSQRLVIYVTLLPDSTTVEAYAVADTADGRSDLWTDALSSASKAPSVLSSWLRQWLSERTAAPSPS